MVANEKWFGASAGFYPETIDQSLRFEDGDSPRLSKTFGSGGNRKTWTWSAWVKRGNISSTQMLFHTFAQTGFGIEGFITFQSDDTITFQFDYNGGSHLRMRTNRVFRDTSNFYHLTFVADSSNSTQDDRMRIYVNGVRETSFSEANYPTNTTTDGSLNSAYNHYISGRTDNTVFFDGYLAEVNFLDGVAVTDTSGVLDELIEIKNGVCIPKEYSGSYGTTGFRLTFADNTNLGDDTSGLSTPNDFATGGSLASTDVVPDSPENSFCTLDPNFRAVTANTLSEGNLKCVTSTSGRSFSAGSFLMTPNSGKWYWEFKVNANAGGMGVAKVNGASFAGAYQSVTSTSTSANTTDYYYGETNFTYYQHNIIHNGGTVTSLSGSAPSPLIYGIGVDMDASPPTITYYDGGSSVGSANLDTGFDYIPIAGDGSGAISRTININFGQDDTFAGTETSVGNTDSNGIGLFHDTVPSGHLALCSANLPNVEIGPNSSTQADDHFNTRLYTGDGQTTQDVTGVGFKPDFTWGKERNSTSGNWLVDSSRGYENFLSSQTTNDESTGITNNNASRSNDGFQTTNSGASNENGKTYASWNWKANGGTTTTNDASATGVGTIDSVIQANQTAGFSIITYTGTGTAGTIAHGLGKTPALLLTKNRTWEHEYSAWLWWHHERDNAFASSTNYAYLNLNTAGGTSTTSFYRGDQISSTVFGVYTNDAINDASYNYVTYAWAEIDGYSKMGTYKGNNSTNGAFVFTGFRPAWLIIKRTDSGQVGNWFIMDSKRIGYNGANYRLVADDSLVEYTGTSSNVVDFLSNGFKCRTTSTNTNNGNYMYMAFAEQPFKFSNAR